jgi:hypothetical protein
LLQIDLAQPLPDGYEVETNLPSGQLRVFDALFYWFD